MVEVGEDFKRTLKKPKAQPKEKDRFFKINQ